MRANDACPAEAMLRDLVSDRLAPDVSERLTDHVGHCVACQRRLAGVEAMPGMGSQLPQLKNKHSDSSQLEQVIKRAKSLRKSPAISDPPSDAAESGEAQADVTAFTQDGYELLEMIGRGGMGVVYKAREQSLDRTVAVKVLAPLLASDASSRERFLREARSAAAIVHPNVITIHAVSAKPPLPYLVMEFVDGVSLQQQLDAGARISIDNVVRIGRQIAAGLSAAHNKGVVHRDIKPGNILLNAQTGKVLLGDFGLARAADHDRLTRTGMLVGTPAYVAPEVLENPESADHRADLFSLGVVLYAMFSGDSPFQADSILATLHRLSAGNPPPLAQNVAGVPDWLSEIVMRLLEKNPDARFQSAAEVRQALGHGLKPQDASLHATSAAPSAHPGPQAIDVVNVDITPASQTRVAKRSSRHRSHNRWTYAGIGVSLLLIAALVFVLLGPDGAGDAMALRSGHDGDQRSQRAQAASPTESRRPSSTHSGLASELAHDGNPFQCVSADGDDIGSFATLEEAIENQRGGGQIEIHRNGVIETKQCSILEGAITITVGEGYEPILVFEPDDEIDLETMFHVEGSLTLSGLELRLMVDDDEDDFTLVRVERTGHVELIDCTLGIDGGGICVFSQADLSLENCRLHAPEATALELDADKTAYTKLRNCWVSGETGFEVSRHQNQSIAIADCTFACTHVLRTYGDHEGTYGSLSIDSRRSLYLCSEGQIVIDEEDPERSDQQVEWIGSENVFAGRLFAVHEDEDTREQGDLSDFDRWKQKFEETGSKYEENPLEIQTEELFEFISDVDFRLSELERSPSVTVGASNSW